jgi:hypothetical protein
MDQPSEVLVKPIISIDVANADLNSAFCVDGTVAVSLALHCSETKLEFTCDKEDRPEIHPISITIRPCGEKIMQLFVVYNDFGE